VIRCLARLALSLRPLSGLAEDEEPRGARREARGRRRLGPGPMATPLILKRANASRSSGQWRDDNSPRAGFAHRLKDTSDRSVDVAIDLRSEVAADRARLWSAARDFAVAAAARARGRRRPGYVRGATFEKVMFPSLPDSPFSTLSHSPSAPPYVGTCAQAMCEDRIIVCPDVATDTRFDAGWRRLYLGCGLHSVQSAPVFGCNGKALGTFVMALKEPGASFDREVSLLGSLTARLDRLGPNKEIAQIGAVIGREFSYRLLAAVASRDDRSLQAGLSHIAACQLILVRGEPPNATYMFKHALLRDAAYATIVRSKRQQLHGRIADVLMTEFSDTVETQPELMAYHLAQAGLTEKANAYLPKAEEGPRQDFRPSSAGGAMDEAAFERKSQRRGMAFPAALIAALGVDLLVFDPGDIAGNVCHSAAFD
jgi:hypothetical protein